MYIIFTYIGVVDLGSMHVNMPYMDWSVWEWLIELWLA